MNYKLKRKHRKLISALWKKLRKIDESLVKTIQGFFNPEPTSVSQEEIHAFREKLNEEEQEQFDLYEPKHQKAIVGKSKDNADFMKNVIGLADVLIAEYEEIDEEIDGLIMAATGLTLEELDDMDFVEFGKVVIEVVKANINF